MLETKHWQHGVRVPLGQHIALTQLSAVSAFTVYLVGEVDEEDKPFRVVPYTLYAPLTQGAYVLFPPSVFEPANKDDMRQLVRQWISAC